MWKPTGEVRFKWSESGASKYLLQQKWIWHVDLWADAEEGKMEWRNVPIVPKDTPDIESP
jgi:hypothetical protein